MLKSILKFLFVFGILFWGSSTYAALPQIYLESSSGVVSTTQFTVTVFLDTKDQINALDVKLLYPQDTLTFIDADIQGSVVDIWPISPKAETAGQIIFTGGLFKPFSGTHGLLVRLHFQAKEKESASVAQLLIIENNLYLANGLGTKIVAETTPLSLTLLGESAVAGESAVQQPEKTEDSTPPILEFRVAGNLLDDSSIAVFYASDAESGIKMIEMRTKIGLRWSAWRSVENFAPLPKDAWVAEVRVINNQGLETAQKKYLWAELFREVRLPLLIIGILALLGAAIYFHYRKLYNKYKNPYAS